MRNMTKLRLTPILFSALLPFLSACDDGGVSGSPDGTTSLSVYLTDAPGDVEAVWVEILGISLQGGDGPVELLGAPTDLILLTDLVGSTQLLVSDAELDPSSYGQLRMRVGDAALLSREDVVYVKGDPVLPTDLDGLPRGELQCPSCSQSGLKVKIPNDQIELEEGQTALVLDFDVAQSFGHKAGNSGKWVMHPVIHGTLTDQPTSALAIGGTVTLGVDSENNPITIPECPAGEVRSLGDFTPTATIAGLVDGDGNPIVRTGDVAEDGTFTIGFLPPGSYSMGYVGGLTLGDYVLSFTATVEPTQVSLTDTAFEEMLYTIQSATCEAAG